MTANPTVRVADIVLRERAAVTDNSSQEQLKAATTTGQFSALGKMALFPIFMLACYLALIAYFKSLGGYRPVRLDSK